MAEEKIIEVRIRCIELALEKHSYTLNDSVTTIESCADASDIVKTAKEFFEFISATT